MARDRATAVVGMRMGSAGLLAAAVVAIFLLGGPSTSPASASCPHAGAHPHDVSLAKLRMAVTCIVNNERIRHHRHSLTPNRQLRRAAQKHTNLMLRKDCFKHACPGEVGLNRRVRRSGYTRGQKAWHFAEDLGYDNTPRQMVKLLLHSAFNRRNLFNRAFRDVGVGVGWGTPKAGLDDRKFETYTLVFGWRRHR